MFYNSAYRDEPNCLPWLIVSVSDRYDYKTSFVDIL